MELGSKTPDTFFQAGWKGDEAVIDFKVIIKQKLNMNTTLAVTHT